MLERHYPEKYWLGKNTHPHACLKITTWSGIGIWNLIRFCGSGGTLWLRSWSYHRRLPAKRPDWGQSPFQDQSQSALNYSIDLMPSIVMQNHIPRPLCCLEARLSWWNPAIIDRWTLCHPRKFLTILSRRWSLKKYCPPLWINEITEHFPVWLVPFWLLIK